jgi:hypothetical protein
MDLNIDNKDLFVRYFLQPISKVSDSCCITLKGNKISCLVCSPDNAIILNNSFTLTNDIEGEHTLNVSDVKKLIRAFEVIEEQSISLVFDKNNIRYKNKNVSFKYHLLEDGVINKPKINLEKINAIEFDSKFDITDVSLSELIKASTFCVDSNKVYLQSSDEGSITAEITDRTRPNIDSFTVLLTDKFEGSTLKSLCLNMEIVRILSTNKVKQMHCKVSNNLGVVLFDYGNKIVYTQYIVSSLTK